MPHHRRISIASDLVGVILTLLCIAIFLFQFFVHVCVLRLSYHITSFLQSTPHIKMEELFVLLVFHDIVVGSFISFSIVVNWYGLSNVIKMFT